MLVEDIILFFSEVDWRSLSWDLRYFLFHTDEVSDLPGYILLSNDFEEWSPCAFGLISSL